MAQKFYIAAQYMMLEKTRTIIKGSKFNLKSILWAEAGDF